MFLFLKNIVLNEIVEYYIGGGIVCVCIARMTHWLKAQRHTL